MHIWATLTLLLLSSFITASATQPQYDNHLSIELLRWKLRVGSADNWAQEISTSGNSRTTKLLHAPFDVDTGVRISSEHTFKSTGLDLAFSYTWFQTSAFTSASVSQGGIYSAYLGNFFVENTNGASFGPNYQSANLHWKFKLNVADIEFGKMYVVNKILKLRPFVGIKGASIRQNIDTTWKNPNPTTFFFISIPQNFQEATEKIQNNFWGIGSVIGLDSSWFLYSKKSCDLSFRGDFSGALMFGRWKFRDKYQNDSGVRVSVNYANVTGASSMIQGFLGAEYKQDYRCFNLQMRVGYEMQIWFNQMQYYNYNMGRLSNLLSIHGLVIGARCAF